MHTELIENLSTAETTRAIYSCVCMPPFLTFSLSLSLTLYLPLPSPLSIVCIMLNLFS